MSVPKSERGESPVEFLANARALYIHSVRKAAGFPKRYTFYVGQEVVRCATDVLKCAKAANTLYPKNAHEAQTRRDWLLRALAQNAALVSLIEAAGELFLEPEKMEYWAGLADKEDRLLRGILKKDEARYKELP